MWLFKDGRNTVEVVAGVVSKKFRPVNRCDMYQELCKEY